MTANDPNEPQAPAKLADALKQLPRERIFVPPYVDAAVMKAAGEQLGGGRSRRTRFRPWILWPAFAAVCVIVAWTARLLLSTILCATMTRALSG